MENPQVATPFGHVPYVHLTLKYHLPAVSGAQQYGPMAAALEADVMVWYGRENHVSWLKEPFGETKLHLSEVSVLMMPGHCEMLP